MKLLVIGRTGQIARCLVEAATGRAGLQVTVAGRPELELEASESIGRVVDAIRPDVVINAAAYTAVDLAEDEPDRAFRINATAAGDIARQCRSAGAGLIQISTDYVFDGTAAEPYKPEARPNPLGVYGRSKLAGEQRVRDEHPDALIVRTAWVYSPFGRNFVKTMMQLGQSHETVRVVADQRGNPSSAGDIAEGLLRIVDQWRDGAGGTYHLAGTGTASWAEFAAEIFALCEQQGLPFARVQPIGTDEWPTRSQRPRNSMLDCTTFARDFGFRMPGWRAALKPVVQRLALGSDA